VAVSPLELENQRSEADLSSVHVLTECDQPSDLTECDLSVCILIEPNITVSSPKALESSPPATVAAVHTADTIDEALPKLSAEKLKCLHETFDGAYAKKLKESKIVLAIQRKLCPQIDQNEDIEAKFDEMDLRYRHIEAELKHLAVNLNKVAVFRSHQMQAELYVLEAEKSRLNQCAVIE
jgi:hypothetical protein